MALTIAQQIAQAQAMLNQTKAEGNKSFAGSSYASPSYVPPPTQNAPVLSQPQLTQIGQQNAQATGTQTYKPPQNTTLSTAPMSAISAQNQNLGIGAPPNPSLPPPTQTPPTIAPPVETPQTNPYEKQYQDLLKPTDTENQLSSQQIALQDSYNKGTVQNEGALAPMSAISGDQQLIDKSYNLSNQTLTQRLALEQSKRQNAIDVSKFAMERADKQMADQAALAKEQRGYAQQLALEQAKIKTPGLTEVSPGATLYNPQTNQSVYTAPTTASQNPTKSPVTSSTKPIVSGSLTTNNNAIGANLQVLNASKTAGAESDGVYADPNIYLQLYQKWTSQGGSPTDFYKYYPPNSFLNPANTWIANSIPGLSKVWTTPVKPKTSSGSTADLLNLFQ